MEEATAYLNNYVAPNNLISISIFEDDHPCENNIYHIVILHRGKGDVLLDKKDIGGNIYSLKFYTSDKGWEEMCDDALKKIDADGFS